METEVGVTFISYGTKVLINVIFRGLKVLLSSINRSFSELFGYFPFTQWKQRLGWGLFPVEKCVSDKHMIIRSGCYKKGGKGGVVTRKF